MQASSTPVEDFQPFPWHLELADVPKGAYWVPSEGSGDDEAPGIVQTLRRFLDSSRFPRVSKLDYKAEGTKPFQLEYHKTPRMDNGTGTIVVRSHARDSANGCMGRATESSVRRTEPWALHKPGPGPTIAHEAEALPVGRRRG